MTSLEISSSGAPLGIGALVKQANLVASTGEANRLIDGGGVRRRQRHQRPRTGSWMPAPLCWAGGQAQVCACHAELSALGVSPHSASLRFGASGGLSRRGAASKR